MILIYVNGLGPNYRGDNMYEFIFGKELDVWGEVAWETDESCENQTRLVFRFGDSEQKVKDKLYERDLILEFDKEVVYEN